MEREVTGFLRILSPQEKDNGVSPSRLPTEMSVFVYPFPVTSTNYTAKAISRALRGV